MKVATAERITAIEAVRRAGGELRAPPEVWATGTRTRREVFVSSGAAELACGEEYQTWVVTLGPDGAALSVECFRSSACRPRQQLRGA